VFKAIVSLLFFSTLEAFFAFSEISFISAEKALIENLARKSRAAQICIKFWREPERLFTTTTLGLTFSIAGNGVFTSYYLIKSLGNIGIFLSTFILPVFVLLFGQIIPKSLGKRFSFPLVLYLAPPLYFISKLVYPVYYMNQWLSKGLLKESGESPYFLTKFRETFLTMISYEEEIDYKEKELINKILEFGRKKVSQVMIPLSYIKALPITATVGEALEFNRKYNFTYIPLYEGELTRIKYIIKMQDLLGKELWQRDLPLIKFARSPLFIPEIVPAHEALKILQREVQEIAIIVNEYGIVSGLITIEDLVEEVLGEFRDALDYYEPEFKRISPNMYVVKGTIEIEKLQNLGIPIPSGEYETLNGFIYKFLNKIPTKGEKFSFQGLELTVLEATPNKVEEVLIKLKS